MPAPILTRCQAVTASKQSSRSRRRFVRLGNCGVPEYGSAQPATVTKRHDHPVAPLPPRPLGYHKGMARPQFTLGRLLVAVLLFGVAFVSAKSLWLARPIEVEALLVIVVGIGAIFGAAIGTLFARPVVAALFSAFVALGIFLWMVTDLSVPR